MPPPRPHPPGTYWRGGVLWAKIKVAGHRYRRSLDTDDPRVASQKVGELRDQIRAQSGDGRAGRTFAAAAEAWEAHIADRVGPRTYARYVLSLSMIESHLRGRLLADIDGPLIAAIIAARRAAGVTVATVKRDLGALSSVMNYAIDEGWIEANPVLARLGRLKERRDPITLPDPAHMEIVARRAPGRLQALIRAAWLTGCRQSELAEARASQFDAARGQLSVVGKGRRRRTLDLSPAAIAVIRPPKGDEWLFQMRDGGPYRWVETRWRKLAHGIEGVPAGPDNDGVRPFPFHHMRHWFAVDYLKSGRGTIYDLQLYLGHSSVKTTEIYLEHLTAAERHRAMFSGAQAGGTKAPENNGRKRRK